jgi:Domain of unknown function (DUF4158)
MHRWFASLPGSIDVSRNKDEAGERMRLADPSRVKRYTERRKTRFDHQWKTRRAYKLREFTDVEMEFADWVAARSWTSGDGHDHRPRRRPAGGGRNRPAADVPHRVGDPRAASPLLTAR